jgi:hypothetical protein
MDDELVDLSKEQIGKLGTHILFHPAITKNILTHVKCECMYRDFHCSLGCKRHESGGIWQIL